MTHGIVVAAQPEAAEAGCIMLQDGGNAFDAAIACALVQGVIDPLMCGIGGVGTALVYAPDSNELSNYNFLGAAPGHARDDMWQDRILGETGDGFGFVLDGQVNAIGHQAAMVPGNLKGYHTIHQRFGSLPWSVLCEPAIEYARHGWVVRPHVYAYAMQNEAAQGRIHNSSILGFTDYGARIYLGPDGNIRSPGQTIRNPDLATALELIARQGADALHAGDLGRAIVEDMQANGGLIDQGDLARYACNQEPVLWGAYRGLRVATNRPGGSGVQVLSTLQVLEHFDLRAMPYQSAEYLRVVAEAIAFAYNDKRNHVGDPRAVDVPLEMLLDPDRARAAAERIGRGEMHSLDRLHAVAPDSVESTETTHVCTLDENGNAFTMTHTLGAPSGVIAPGTGFMLNGCMSIFDPRPGLPTSIGPCKAYTSSMSPTMVFDGDDLEILIGAPGATYIPQAITQALVNSIDRDMTMLEAVSAPRIAVTRNRTIDISNRIPRFREAELRDFGYAVQRHYASYAFAGVHGIRIKGAGTDKPTWDGAADPGRDGMALTV